MPQVIKNKIIYDHRDWLYGLDPQSGVGYPKIFGGLDTAIYFDPFRYFGYASPGFLPADVTNASLVATMLRRGVSGSDGKGYAVGGALLHQITPGTGAIANGVGDFPYTIVGTGVIAYDVILYNVSGTKKIFYSWRDNTDGDVGTFDMNTTFDPVFMSTNVGTGAAAFGKDHTMPMVEGADKNLYIGVGNLLHQYSGSTDTLVPSKLTLPAGWHIKSFAKYDQMDYLVIFADNAGSTPLGVAYNEVRAFFWDYASPQHLYSIKLDGEQLGGAFENFDGTFGAFTYGLSVDHASQRQIHINAFTGSRFKRLMSIPSQAIPIHGGVEVVGGMIFVNCGGYLYSYGSPFLGIRAGLHCLAKGSGTGNGMVKSFSSNRRLISSGATMSGGCQIVNSNYQSNASAQTGFGEPLFNPGKKGQIESVQTIFGKASTGGRTLSLDMLTRDGTTISIISALGTISAGGLVREDKMPSKNTSFDALQALLSWTTGSGITDAPIVSKIIVTFSEINI